MAATIDYRVAELERANAQLRRQLDACSAELKEAREQQTATAEVLQVINSSPGDLVPVFEAILDRSKRLCDADSGIFWVYRGEHFRPAASIGVTEAFGIFLAEHPDLNPSSRSLEAIERGEEFVHNLDLAEINAGRTAPLGRAVVDLEGARTGLLVPLLKDGTLLGAIRLLRREVRPFTDKQIALLQNFAAQAVIAMENARLLTETREALEQQTATAEVLQVINSSPGDLAPVFDAMLEKATRLCQADIGILFTYFDGSFTAASWHGTPTPFKEFLTREPLRPSPDTGLGRMAREHRLIHLTDVSERGSYRRGDPLSVASVELGGIRTFMAVPLVKDDELVGAFVIYRQEVRPFSEREIALLENFSTQAVIAMENARLMTETREALEQQTATAEVLQVINSSPGDLAPVFDAMLENATRLCDGVNGILWTIDGKRARLAASRNMPSAIVELLRRQGEAGEHPMVQRVIAGEHLFQFDLAEHDVYRLDEVAAAPHVVAAGVRTIIWVAMVKDGAAVGAFVISRNEIRPFTEKQIALLQNFAAQAVIAMENARLLTETREALEQQTATAEVLQVINASPGDLAPVFDAVIENSMRLCEATQGHLYIYADGQLHAEALRGEPQFIEWQRRRGSHPVTPGSPTERALRGEQVIHIADATQIETYRSSPAFKELIDRSGIRTGVTVALRRDEAFLGTINVYRQEVRPFADKQIALLQNFAAQAVIAMENARLLTETREALEQQTATAEVLQVINSSPGDLEPVFQAMLQKAMRLCEAAFGTLWTIEADRFRPVAHRGVPARYAEHLDAAAVGPAFTLPSTSLSGRAFRGESFAQVVDLADEELYRAGDPDRCALVDLGGARTGLAIPLRKDKAVVGVILIYRQEVRPFTDKQIALLQNFAAQAVIAMENARLITETREALEQQTATAEVLQVINSSPGDLVPVFDAMLNKAVRLCDFAFAALWTYDGTAFHPVALHGMPAAFEAYLREHTPPAFKLLHDSAGPIHFPDVMATEMPQRDPEFARVTQQLATVRTLLLVPLRKDAGLLGAFVAYRQEVRPFSDKQIALLQNFAAQAVIAMENARLLTETREALEQQTATAEVLQVINSSPGDLAPVFDAMLEKATNLCEAQTGVLWTYHGEEMQPAAILGAAPGYEEYLRQGLRPLSPNHAHLSHGAALVHIPDIPADPVYAASELARALVELGGVRTILMVPMRKDSATLGAFCIYRKEPRPFTDKQIALLQNFAAQAVIAMENARLLTETREALEQQTATAEVLQVINSSPGDLAPVFDAMLEKAMRLCEAAFGTLWTYDGNRFRSVAQRGVPGPYADYLAHNTPPASAGTGRARVLRGEPFAHIADLKDEEPYRAGDSHRRAMVDLGGARTGLTVPLRKDDAVIGVVMIYRQQVRPFSHKQIALLQNFAAQAVIAMENARLLNELRQRTRDLQESLEYQTATSDVLKVISQSGSEIEPVLETLLETAARICEADKGVITRLQNGLYRAASSFGFPAEYEDLMARSPIAPGRGSCVGRAALERRVVHIEDAATDPEFTWTESQQLGQLRTMLGVPLFREDALIGVISLARSRVEPFTEKQIALVRTFADQAVIAIENARLFNELRARTAELGRSVEELKMLSEVGRAVSSTLDLRAVLSTILTASLGMTWANAGAIFRYIRAERAFRLVEAVGWDEALLGSVGDLSIAETETLMSEAALSRTPIQLTDLAELPSTRLRDASLAAGLRSVLIVPLVGPERIFGALVLQRREAGEFPAETVRLMQTLASQSVLAIQNARLFREIADKSEQLALASQHKSQFLANMSHELRTPLNAILGYAELLVDGIYGVLPEKAQGVLERVQNNGKHLLALINDVLDLAKIEAGQLALTLEDYALAELVRGVVTATEPLAAAKGLKFTAIVQDGMPMAHGDARRVSQVLLNLAGNAIKFTDQGEVAIDASAVNGQFVLTVRDTGPGIADADQERIFGEFQQIDNSDTRKKGGTGLGLAISKRMVEMQGGMISVESVLGAGSTFRVVLPVHVEPALEEAA